ncbi:MAG: AbrB/MazE/SpoVT family DNA-binding domain-containing protein [Candidatus Saccharimonadales bacterium]
MSNKTVATQSLQKWGNSAGVRLPKKIIKAARLKLDQQLVVSLSGQSIVLTPVQPEDDFTLEKMLEGVTPENVHGEIDWGPDVGAEIIND